MDQFIQIPIDVWPALPKNKTDSLQKDRVNFTTNCCVLLFFLLLLLHRLLRCLGCCTSGGNGCRRETPVLLRPFEKPVSSTSFITKTEQTYTEDSVSVIKRSASTGSCKLRRSTSSCTHCHHCSNPSSGGGEGSSTRRPECRIGGF